MKSQVEFLRTVLEGLARDGAVQYHFGKDFEELRPSGRRQAQKIAEMILEEFPEEDSDHVKAYRALVFLTRYIEDGKVDVETPVGGASLDDRLLRLQSPVGEKARSEIQARLEVDKSDLPFGGDLGKYHITDPVTKYHSQISGPTGDHDIETYVNQSAHQILEAPI